MPIKKTVSIVLFLVMLTSLSTMLSACGGKTTPPTPLPMEESTTKIEETPEPYYEEEPVPTEEPEIHGTKPVDFGLGKSWEIKGSGFHPNIFNINNDYTWICLLESRK